MDFLLPSSPGLLMMSGIIFIRVILLFGMASVRCWLHGGLSAEEDKRKGLKGRVVLQLLLLVWVGKAAGKTKGGSLKLQTRVVNLMALVGLVMLQNGFLLIPNCYFKILCAKCPFLLLLRHETVPTLLYTHIQLF